MWKNIVVLFLPLAMFIEKGHCLECYICSGLEKDGDPCSNPKQYPASDNLKLANCDFSNSESTWNFAKQIHLNYTNIFKITPGMFAAGSEMNCVNVLSRLGNTNHIVRGCALKGQDICSGVRNFENEYLKNLHCSVCDTDKCNSAESLAQNFRKIVLFITITVLFIILG